MNYAEVIGTKPRRHDEADLQKAVIQHLKLLAPENLIYYHPANGEHRSKRSAARLKAQGVVPGVPDLALILPDGRAAFLELKTLSGRLSPEQKAFQAKCIALGVEHSVAHSIDAALQVLVAWGALPKGVV